VSINSRYPLRTSRSTPSDTSGVRVTMLTLLVPIAAVLIRTLYIAIGMSVFNVPSGRMEHVLHSSIVPKLDLDTWSWSVNLHHRYFVVRKRYLSINPFMNLICRSARTLKVKCTQDRNLRFTHFECGPSSSQTRQRKRTNLNRYKT